MNDQVKGITERAVTVLATIALNKMVNRGWLGESDVAALLPFIVLLPSLLYGWWINRPLALVQSVAAIPGTVVVTQPELAKTTPETNVISNTEAVIKSSTGSAIVPPT